MDGNKALITYETKGEATEEAAQKIAEILRSKYQLEGDLVDLKEQKVPDLSQYRNLVIGGGVRAGRVYDKVLKFLENDHSGKRVAFFVSSAEAGSPFFFAFCKVSLQLAGYFSYSSPSLIPLSICELSQQGLFLAVFDKKIMRLAF